MRIKASELKLSKEYGKGWLLSMLVDEDWIQGAKMAVDEHLDAVSVEIKPYRVKRSLDANNYCWLLIGKIANKLRQDKLSVYRQAVRDLGDNFDFVCVTNEAAPTFKASWESKGDGWLCDEVACKIDGCTKYQIYYGSSSYDSALMSSLIDRLTDEAKSLGIQLMSEKEVNDLKDGWR